MPLIDTETHWSVDDVPLQSFAYNVEEISSKFGTPNLRGDDSIVPYHNGNLWNPKTPDAREIPLGMWISGRDPATGGITALGRELQFQKNMHELQRLLYHYGRRQVKLTKRWRDPLDPETILEASALAEVRVGLQPKVEPGAFAARMVVNFQLSDPYFYGEPQTTDLVKDVPKTITVDGDAPTSVIELVFIGQLGNGKITNSTPTPDHWVQVGSAIAVDDSITLDTNAFTASRESDSANMISAVTRSGGREWMEFVPGNNVLTLTASSGSGTATVSWTPVYL